VIRLTGGFTLPAPPQRAPGRRMRQARVAHGFTAGHISSSVVGIRTVFNSV
jgi:hypothetical protein